MRIGMCLGVRPDWIDNSLLIKELDKWLGKDFTLIHSGQHYSYNMNKIFFDELRIRKPDYFLDIGSGTQGYQAGETIRKSEAIFLKKKVDLVIAFSDANPALSCIGAAKNNIKVAHLEAGMRAWDWRMPEEKNKRMIDSISDYFFTPTNLSCQNLLNEGVYKPKIFIVGKQVIDVLEYYSKDIERSQIMDKLNLDIEEYFLVTAHRPENVENRNSLENIIKALNKISEYHDLPVIFPAHPRTQAALKRWGIKLEKGIRLMDYLGFLDFSKLEMNALCLLTDSGTVEEDGCWFRVPCVTFRISTERPETVHCGSNIVVGTDYRNIIKGVKEMIRRPSNWNCPYYLGATDNILYVLRSEEENILKEKVWW